MDLDMKFILMDLNIKEITQMGQKMDKANTIKTINNPIKDSGR